MPETQWYDPEHGAVTPWGNADTRETYLPGVDFYSTPSHGGFRLSKVREAELDAVLRRHGMTAEQARMGYPEGWYEEDCCALAVLAAFPETRNPDSTDGEVEYIDRLHYWTVRHDA